MKFNKLVKIINEKNIYYKVPKDKKEQMFDFYLLTFIRDLPVNKDNPAIQQQDISITTSVQEAAESITNELQSKLLDAVEFALSAEFRHIFENNSAKPIIKAVGKRNPHESAARSRINSRLRACNIARKRFIAANLSLSALKRDLPDYADGFAENSGQHLHLINFPWFH